MSSPSACYSNHSSVRLHPPESDISIAQPQVRKKLHGNSVVGARFIAPTGWRGVNVRMSLPHPVGAINRAPTGAPCKNRTHTISYSSHCQNVMSMICFAHKIGAQEKQYSETFNISSETLGNEGLQPPLPGQGQEGQQKPYYGWQYDQDQPGSIEQQQQTPVVAPQPDYPPQQQYPLNR